MSNYKQFFDYSQTFNLTIFDYSQFFDYSQLCAMSSEVSAKLIIARFDRLSVYKSDRRNISAYTNGEVFRTDTPLRK